MAFSRWHCSKALAIVLLCGWAPLLLALDGSPPNEYELTISSGSLLQAIRQFSEQTDVQVTVDSQAAEVDVVQIDGFRARLSARAALARILSGSTLSADWQGSHTVRIFSSTVIGPQGDGGQHAVEVTGTRLGGGEGPAPIRVYGREEIDRLGVSSLPALATYFTQQPFSFGEWSQRSGAQHFQMRGLGVDTTLVLINGRRTSLSATSVNLNAFDLNTVPITAIERVEVMSDSASAIYGSDAIGGVVNIILRDDVTAPDVYMQYGGSNGGAAERRVAVSMGTPGPRLRSSLTLDYFDRTMLIGDERDLWRDQDFRRFGGKDYRTTAAPRANIYSLNGTPLPGLPTSQASVPIGSSGNDLGPDDFRATAGVVSLYSSQKTWSIVPDMNRLSAIGSAELALGGGYVVFGDMLLTKSNVVAQGPLSAVTGQIVPANNPYNPFGQPVRVDFSLAGTKPVTISTDTRTTRFVLGARGALGRGDWELAVARSDEDVDVARANDLDLPSVQLALRSTDSAMALNPFSDGPTGSTELLSSLMSAPKEFGYFSQAQQLSGFIRGPLFPMPGGMSEFVLGGELRREEVQADDTAPLDQERDIASEFAELKLPLLKGLTLKLAVRADFYEHADDSLNPQYGLVWRPSNDWLVRIAYGTSFRPPSLAELAYPRSEFSIPLPDPRRGNLIAPVMVTVGGNPDLANVSAHSFTTGLMYRPNSQPGLHWGAHYWRVMMDNRIVVPRPTDLERLEEKINSRVVRAAPTESDILAGRPGALQSMDVSLLNYGRLKTSGIDLDVAYRVSGTLGNVQGALTATWVDEYAPEDLAPIASSDRVGIANYLGTVPEWRVVGSLAWEDRGLGVATTATYTPSYQDADLTGVLNRQLPSRTIIDVQAWLELGRILDSAFFERLRITAGAANLLDENVDFANAGLSFGYDVSQSDLRRRFAYLRITKRF